MLLRLKAVPIFLLPVLWLAGCSSSVPRLSTPIAGGQAIALEREGSGFKRAENDRILVTDAALQAVNLNGNNYVRWRFAISPKQAAVLSSLRIEDVTDPAPFLLINDVAPQLDAGQWTETGGMLEVTQGLSADDQVIVNPSDGLASGQRVRTRPLQSPKKTAATPAGKQAVDL